VLLKNSARHSPTRTECRQPVKLDYFRVADQPGFGSSSESALVMRPSNVTFEQGGFCTSSGTRSGARKWQRGDVIVVGYADDLVLGFQYQAEAERFLQAIRKRLAKFGLELHADKTGLIEFGVSRSRPDGAFAGCGGAFYTSQPTRAQGWIVSILPEPWILRPRTLPLSCSPLLHSILGKTTFKRTCTDLYGGDETMVVPTATIYRT
jgi:hypothetical protein